MKTKFLFLLKKIAILQILGSMFFMVYNTSLFAQTVYPNIRVNTYDYEGLSLDVCAKAIAVLNDTVFIVWQAEPTDSTSEIFFSKSTNGGATFTPEIKVTLGLDTLEHYIPSLAVNQNGDIFIAWTGFGDLGNIWFTKSTDGGSTFNTPVQITNGNFYLFSAIKTFNNNVYIFYADADNDPCADYYFTRSTNGGQTFDAAIQINNAPCTGFIKFDGVLSMEVDSLGVIYLTWADGRRTNGNGDIYFSKSTDNGLTFSTNVMVNDIMVQGADSVQYKPSIAIDELNNVYISYIDQRDGDNKVFMNKSTNGGATFSSETYLAGFNNSFYHKDIVAAPNGNLYAALCVNENNYYGAYLYESTDGGVSFSLPISISDTFNIDAKDINITLNQNKDAFIAWTDIREGETNLYFARKNFIVNVSDLEYNAEYKLFPNPTNSSFYVQMPQSNGNVDIKVYSSHGQIVYNKSYKNPSLVHIDIDIPQGIYFVSIISVDKIKTFKIIKN